MIRFAPGAQQTDPTAADLVPPSRNRRRQALSEALMARAPAVVTSGGQGAAMLGMGAISGLMDGMAERRERDSQVAAGQALANAVGNFLPPGMDRKTFETLSVLSPGLASQIANKALERAMNPQERFEMITLPDGRKAQRSSTTGKIDVLPEGRGPMAVGAGQTVIDPRTGQTVFAAPAKPDTMSPEAEAQKLRIARAQKEGDAPTTRQIKQPDGSEVAVQWDSKSGAWVPMPAPQGGNPVAGPRKLTEQQSKDLVYFNRGIQALEIFDAPRDPKNPKSGRLSDAMANGWEGVVGRVTSALPGGNLVTPETYQRADQAGRNFLASILRKDTGAAVTTDEMSNYGRIFLPAPGDAPSVLDQKAEARRQALEAIKNGLGTAKVLARASEMMRPREGQQAAPQATPQATPQSAPAPQATPQSAPEGPPAPQLSLDAINAEIERRMRQQQQQAQPFTGAP
jgi:hypothetical protein